MSIDLRELEKAVLQYFFLPVAYGLFCCVTQVNPRKVIFADSKNHEIPYSLKSMYKETQKRGYECIDFCYNFEKMSAWKKLCTSILFMKEYATAKYVFISDYYLPVSSCHKRNETKVIQLWHASGLQKMFGYDAEDDLKSLKLINPVRNFDLVSVSAENMKQVVVKNWRLPADRVQVLGTSRTDILFDQNYLAVCREKFYQQYPEAKGKKVVLWAPTFRGKGYEAEIKGIEEICSAKDILKGKYFFIFKLHPNIHNIYDLESCELRTEELYAVTDLLITDYSSVFYDYLLLKSKVIFFVPDYQEYKSERGLYIDYLEEFKFPVVKKKEELLQAIELDKQIDSDEIEQYKRKYVIMNNGKASIRILDFLEGNNS